MVLIDFLQHMTCARKFLLPYMFSYQFRLMMQQKNKSINELKIQLDTLLKFLITFQ